MKTYTEEEEEQMGEKLAIIFKLKRSKEYPDCWIMDQPYPLKSSIGVFRTFCHTSLQNIPEAMLILNQA